MNTDGLKFSKPRPAALERQDRRTALKAQDEAENKKVKARSGYWCEVVEMVRVWTIGRWKPDGLRCERRAAHIHHMLGGNGTRARGESALAIRKQHCCATCHSEITQHILTRIGGHVPRWDDTYRRAR